MEWSGTLANVISLSQTKNHNALTLVANTHTPYGPLTEYTYVRERVCLFLFKPVQVYITYYILVCVCVCVIVTYFMSCTSPRVANNQECTPYKSPYPLGATFIKFK